jgi:hypothetical protein
MTDIAMGLDRDEAASVMSVLLAERTAGAGVFDAAQRLRTSSTMLGTMLGLPDRLARADATLDDILDHAAAKGLLGEPNATQALFAEPSGGVLAWKGAAGRHLELTVRPLRDGMRLALWRDITQQERDRAALNEDRARSQRARVNPSSTSPRCTSRIARSGMACWTVRFRSAPEASAVTRNPFLPRNSATTWR